MGWLILSIIGTCLTIVSAAFICWGIQIRLLYTPLLPEFPVLGDDLETIRIFMTYASLALIVGIVFLSLGIFQYLRKKSKHSLTPP